MANPLYLHVLLVSAAGSVTSIVCNQPFVVVAGVPRPGFLTAPALVYPIPANAVNSDRSVCAPALPGNWGTPLLSAPNVPISFRFIWEVIAVVVATESPYYPVFSFGSESAEV